MGPKPTVLVNMVYNTHVKFGLNFASKSVEN